MKSSLYFIRHRIICASIVILLNLLGASVGAQTLKPNIIFILADDLGYGDIGFNRDGAFAREKPRLATPNLDRLARGGVILSDHYCAAPVCSPSRASLLTGRIQGRCSLRDNLFRPAVHRKSYSWHGRKRGGLRDLGRRQVGRRRWRRIGQTNYLSSPR